MERRGMADAGRDVVGPMVLGAWDDFLAAAADADLSLRSRLPGWRGHEVCVHLGRWDDHDAMTGLLASARTGGSGTPPDVDAANDAVTAAHRDAAPQEVLAALQRGRDAVARHLAEGDPALDTAWTTTTVGRLPLLSVLLGQAYELAVHGLDLVPCGAPPPRPSTLDAGLAALADVTGALAAASGIEAGAALQTPDGGWRFDVGGSGWSVERTPPGRLRGSVVEAPAEVLLDASAGRTNPVALLARRRLQVHDLPGLLALAPIVEQTPGVPGGPILRLAARTLSGAGRFLRR